MADTKRNTKYSSSSSKHFCYRLSKRMELWQCYALIIKICNAPSVSRTIGTEMSESGMEKMLPRDVTGSYCKSVTLPHKKSEIIIKMILFFLWI
jgi:hypothetical protein